MRLSPFDSAPLTVTIKKGKATGFKESPELLSFYKIGHSTRKSNLGYSWLWILGSCINCGFPVQIRTGEVTKS